MDPAIAGPSNVVNINIKTSNESLAFAPESVQLRTLPPSGTKGAESENRTSRRLRSSRSNFRVRPLLRVKMLSRKGGGVAYPYAATVQSCRILICNNCTESLAVHICSLPLFLVSAVFSITVLCKCCYSLYCIVRRYSQVLAGPRDEG